jgi:hypothetical protein
VDLAELQDVIERTYGHHDRARGVPGTVAWLAEETGELAQALRKGTREEIEHEFSDVLAWVATPTGARSAAACRAPADALEGGWSDHRTALAIELVLEAQRRMPS